MENNCTHYDYGKTADKSLGAYCTLKKVCVETEDCERCKEETNEQFIQRENDKVFK